MWGCLAKVNIPEPKKRKLGPKTVDIVSIGYAHNSNTYRFLVIKSKISEIANNTILESRDASFFEDIFSFKTKILNEISFKSIDSVLFTSKSLESQPEAEIEPESRRSKKKGVEKI